MSLISSFDAYQSNRARNILDGCARSRSAHRPSLQEKTQLATSDTTSGAPQAGESQTKVAPAASSASAKTTSGPIFASPWLRRTFESLTNRDYRMMWIGMFLSMGGFNMLMLARGILVVEITDNNAVIASAVSIGWAPGLLVMSLVGGALGDRVERRMLIQASQFGNAALALIIGCLILTGLIEWWHMLTVSIMQGCLFALQMPARTAATVQIVSRDQLPNAMALNATAMTLMSVASPAVGGVLYEAINPEGVYFVVTAMQVGALFFTSLLPRLEPDPNRVKERTFAAIAHGIQYIFHNRLVMLLLVQSVVVAMLSMPFRMLVPVFAFDLYGSQPSEVGWLAMMAGFGGIAASLGVASLRAGQKRGWVLLLSPIIYGISMLVMGLLPFYMVGIAMFIGVGLGETIRFALGQALVVEHSDNEYRARMTSLTMMTYGFIPIAALAMGGSVETFGAQASLIGISIALLVVSVLFIIVTPSIRRL